MTMQKRAMVAAVWLVLTVNGCGDDDGPATSSTLDLGDPSAAAEFCESKQQAYCAIAENCQWNCDSNERRLIESFRTGCDNDAEAVGAKRRLFDSTAAAACLEAMNAMICGDQVGPGRLWNNQACEKVFLGVLPEGEPCAQWNDCAGGYCQIDGVCPGVCIAYKRLDEACGGDDDTIGCSQDLYCDEMRCKKRLPIGHVCDEAPNACAIGTQCRAAADPEDPSTCRGQTASGGACTTSQECEAPLACLENGTCGATSAGSPCGINDVCAAGLRCYVAAGDDAQACHTPLEEGDACTHWRACETGLGCAPDEDDPDSQHCRGRGSAGDSCTHVSCKDDLACVQVGDEATCRALAANGDACSSGEACVSGVCRDSLCSAPGSEDDACVAWNTGTCEEGLYCQPLSENDSAGTCVALRGAGGDCTWQMQNGTTVCEGDLLCECNDMSCDEVASMCVMRGAVGDDCDNHQQCQSRACVGEPDAGKCADRDGLSALILACVPALPMEEM